MTHIDGPGMPGNTGDFGPILADTLSVSRPGENGRALRTWPLEYALGGICHHHIRGLSMFPYSHIAVA